MNNPAHSPISTKFRNMVIVSIKIKRFFSHPPMVPSLNIITIANSIEKTFSKSLPPLNDISPKRRMVRSSKTIKKIRILKVEGLKNSDPKFIWKLNNFPS